LAGKEDLWRSWPEEGSSIEVIGRENYTKRSGPERADPKEKKKRAPWEKKKERAMSLADRRPEGVLGGLDFYIAPQGFMFYGREGKRKQRKERKKVHWVLLKKGNSIARGG